MNSVEIQRAEIVTKLLAKYEAERLVRIEAGLSRGKKGSKKKN